MPALDEIEHLVGMQAQAPRAPYVALWSRLAGFAPAELEALVEERHVVRAAGMLRTTIHLVSAADARAMRPVLQLGVVERAFRSGSPFARNLVGLPIDEVTAFGRELLAERPRSTAELGRILGERWPDRDAVSLAMAVRYLVPLVQVPPRGLWSRSAPPKFAVMEDWLDRPLTAETAPDAFVLRYLAAFGPASVADVATWSWLTEVRAVMERLRPGLRVFRDEQGRELFDVPDGLLADPDTPAPPRFLPDYDNIVLSHADRSRIVPAHVRQQVLWDWGPLLVDGFVAGTWKIVRVKDAATLRVRTFHDLASADAAAVTDEGGRLLAFMAAGAEPRDVTIVTDPEQMNGRVR